MCYMLKKVAVHVAMEKQESIRTCVCVLNEMWIDEYGLYMFRVAYMLYAQEHCCKCCDGSLFYFSEQENARKNKDVSVLTRFDLVECGLYMFCVACMIFAFDAAVKCAIALLFTSKKNKCKTYKNMFVLTRLYVFFKNGLYMCCEPCYDLCSWRNICDSSPFYF